jgi:hypothetical protein
MADRVRAVQEAFEARQDSTEKALEALLSAIDKNEARKKDQAAIACDKTTARDESVHRDRVPTQYPPDSQDEAVRTVLKQSELLCSDWV